MGTDIKASSNCVSETPEPQGEQPIRVLLADDDPAIRMVFQKLLENAGYHVRVVENGEQATEEVQRHEFDVVILDLLMPIMDGMEAAATIRKYQEQSGRRFPILASTSHAVDKLGQTFEQAGFDAHLRKPFQPMELAAQLASLLQ